MRIQSLKIALLLPVLFLLSLSARADPFLASDGCESAQIISSAAVMDVGAACANSAPGLSGAANQTWRNLLQYNASIPETKAEDACPLILGGSADVTTNDPVLTGLPGHKGTYYAMNGSACLFNPAAAPIFVNSWGKTTGFHVFTYVTTFKFVHSGVAQGLMATKFSGSNRGINFFITAGDRIAFLQYGDTAQSTQATHTTVLVDGTNYIAALAYDGTTVYIWVGSGTALSAVRAYNATASDPSGRMSVGCLSDGTAVVANGTRIYDALAFDAVLDNTTMGSLITFLEARNGLDFTP